MKKLLPVVLFVILAITQFAWSQTSDTPIAFVHVAVVDVRSGETQPDMTVLLSKNRISQIGSSKIVHVPKNVRTIDARGKYLIPGLWDMHVHGLWDSKRPATFFPLFLANGVTGVREMGGSMPAVDQVRWRNQVATGAGLDLAWWYPARLSTAPIQSGRALSKLLPPTMARELSRRSKRPEWIS